MTQLLWFLIGAAIGAFNGAVATWAYLTRRHDCLPHDPARCRGTVRDSLSRPIGGAS